MAIGYQSHGVYYAGRGGRYPGIVVPILCDAQEFDPVTFQELALDIFLWFEYGCPIPEPVVADTKGGPCAHRRN